MFPRGYLYYWKQIENLCSVTTIERRMKTQKLISGVDTEFAEYYHSMS